MATGHAPQVGREHARVRLHLGGRALGDDGAELQHGDAVGQVHHEFHVVFHHQNGQPFGAQLRQQLGQRLLLKVAQAGGRLVQQQQAGSASQRAGDFEDALLAQGQLPASACMNIAQAERSIWRAASASRRASSARSSAQRRRHHAAWPRRCAPIATFSSTLHRRQQRTCWKVRLMPSAAISRGACPATDWPSGKRTCPRSGIHAGEHVEEACSCRRRWGRSAPGSRRP
jgi:hypothetical protein